MSESKKESENSKSKLVYFLWSFLFLLFAVLTIFIVFRDKETETENKKVDTDPIIRNLFQIYKIEGESIIHFKEKFSSSQMYILYLQEYFEVNKISSRLDGFMNFRDFFEILEYDTVTKLSLEDAKWSWVKEESPFGVIIPNEKGYSETRSFDKDGTQTRILNDSSPDKSNFTLEGSLIKSIDDTGYETIERILKLSLDTLIIRIDKFENTKTYVSNRYKYHDLDYLIKISTINERELVIYKQIEKSVRNGNIPLNVKDVRELTNENGVSWLNTNSTKTFHGRKFLNGKPYTGFYYWDEPYVANIQIGKVKDGWNNSFVVDFYPNTSQYQNSYYQTNVNTTKYYINGWQEGRENYYNGQDVIQKTKYYIGSIEVARQGY